MNTSSRAKWWLAAFCLISSSVGAAPPTPRPPDVGLLKCEQWIRWRERALSGTETTEDRVLSVMTTAWMQGFAYGAVAGFPSLKQKAILAVPDYEALQGWTDKYCRDKPADIIAGASGMLVAELIDQIRK